ncbi:MAG: nodulation protein NfeD [Nitrospiraceae bacterium]|nr:MAG: nodulation protein NfeD [Nitrospiraceae bacterium]
MIKNIFSLLLFLLITIFAVEKVNAEIVVINVEGIVNPVMSEFITKSIDAAEKEKANVLIIKLDTPGGLDTSMRSIVKKIISSEVPVVVYVSPSGARAASAGVFITLAAHVAAMAPGTNIGAAHPVGVGGKMDKTMAEKAVNDASAYIKSLAEQRGRNAEWAEQAVRESVSITEQEALKLNVIDIVAPDMKSLLETIDQREVQGSTGKLIIQTKGIKISYKEMGVRHKILDIISDPSIAYMLMLLGMYGIFFELTNPGVVLPGVLGALALILALYSFQTLPVNYAGLLLIFLAIVLFILELAVTSYGMLTIAGLISLTLGSIMLYDSPLPFYQLSLKVILPAVILTTLFFSLTVYLAVKAYRRQPTTGSEGLIGLTGEARTDVHDKGQVFVNGELWQAWSDEPVSAGNKIIVEKVENLKLKVKKQTQS